MHFPSIRFLVCTVSVLALSTLAFAERDRDRTELGHNITVGPDEEVTDATCFGCSVHVRGHVSGDVTTFGGSIVVEDNGQVDGDATTFAGNVRVGKDADISGDVTVFGGRLQRDPAANVGGDVTNFGGSGWIFLIFLTPLVVIGLFVAAVVWIIRRLLRPAPVAA